MIAKVTQRTELGPLRALATARHARVECAFRRIPLQCAHLTLMPDSAWDPDSRSGCASRVAMMQSADRREGDDLPSIDGLGLAWFGGVLVERELTVRFQARSGGREQGIQQVNHRGKRAWPEAPKRQRLCARRGFELYRRSDLLPVGSSPDGVTGAQALHW